MTASLTLSQHSDATISDNYPIETPYKKYVKLEAPPERLTRSQSLLLTRLVPGGSDDDVISISDEKLNKDAEIFVLNSCSLENSSFEVLSTVLGSQLEPEIGLKRNASDAQIKATKPECSTLSLKLDAVSGFGSGLGCLPNREPQKRPDLQTILSQIKNRTLSTADTPILTDTLAMNNLLRVKIPEAKVLQEFAEGMKDDKKFKLLKTRPVTLKVKRKSSASSIGCETRSKSKQTQIERGIDAEVVLKVFLNGTGEATDKFVSVCLSVVNKSETRQNVLEEQWLIVSVYMKQPNSDDKPYRRDFKMKFSSALEKGEKGLLEFISKKDFTKFVSENGSVTMGLSLVLSL